MLQLTTEDTTANWQAKLQHVIDQLADALPKESEVMARDEKPAAEAETSTGATVGDGAQGAETGVGDEAAPQQDDAAKPPADKTPSEAAEEHNPGVPASEAGTPALARASRPHVLWTAFFQSDGVGDLPAKEDSLAGVFYCR
jgi:hypothetical protein